MSYTGSTLSTFTSALTKLFEDRIVGCINRAVVGAQLLDVVYGRGQNIQWIARTGTAVPAGAVIGDGADVSTYNSDTKNAAVLQYGTYHDAIAVSDKALAAARNSTNPSEMLDLLAEETMESVSRLAAAIGAGFYTGTGATNYINGLLHTAGGDPAGALQATGTYAGIDRSSATQWASNVLSNGGVGRALTLDLMRQMDRTIYEASGEQADLILCDAFQHEKYGQLMKAERRYVQNVTLRGQNIVLDGGYRALEFDGIPVVRDAACPTGVMLFLNTRHVKMYQLPDPDATVQLGGTPESQFGAAKTKLTARIKALAPTGAHVKLMLDCWPQVVVKRPSACGHIKDLLTS